VSNIREVIYRHIESYKGLSQIFFTSIATRMIGQRSRMTVCVCACVCVAIQVGMVDVLLSWRLWSGIWSSNTARPRSSQSRRQRSRLISILGSTALRLHALAPNSQYHSTVGVTWLTHCGNHCWHDWGSVCSLTRRWWSHNQMSGSYDTWKLELWKGVVGGCGCAPCSLEL